MKKVRISVGDLIKTKWLNSYEYGTLLDIRGDDDDLDVLIKIDGLGEIWTNSKNLIAITDEEYLAHQVLNA